MGRRPCCAKEGLNRGTWTVREDKILTDYINTHGEGKWRDLPLKAGLKRCGKSCRLRWLNYLRPDIKRGNISPEEDELIVKLHKLLGNRDGLASKLSDVFQWFEFYLGNGQLRSTKCRNKIRVIENTSDGSDTALQAALQGVLPTPSFPSKLIIASSRWIRSLPSNMLRVSFNLCSTTGSRWSLIAGRLPGRTDNEIKNYWHTKLSKINERQKSQNSRKTHNKLKLKESTAIKPTTRAESHKVIRTKAVRCTKPVLPLQLNDPLASINESLTCNPTESPNSTPTLVHQDDSSNFLTDFDISDLLISDVVIDSTYQQQESNDSSFHLLDTFEAMQWNSTDEALELKSIASFFDSEEEWINR